MKKLLYFVALLLTGCAGVSWEPVNVYVKGYTAANSENKIFRNVIYYRNNSRYCQVRLSPKRIPVPLSQPTKFNPVKNEIVLNYGGEQRFIEYNFHQDKAYQTRIYWYLNGAYLSQKDIRYQVVPKHMGEQHIELNNLSKACQIKQPVINIKIN